MGLTDKHLAYGDDIPQTQTEKDYYWKINYQQSCNDCISRQEALNVVHKYFEHYLQLNDDICLDGLRSLPSVTPKEKTGKWIKYSIPRCGEQHYQCTSCGYYINFGQWGEVYTKQFKYCPSCSARMIEPQESEVGE